MDDTTDKLAKAYRRKDPHLPLSDDEKYYLRNSPLGWPEYISTQPTSINSILAITSPLNYSKYFSQEAGFNPTVLSHERIHQSQFKGANPSIELTNLINQLTNKYNWYQEYKNHAGNPFYEAPAYEFSEDTVNSKKLQKLKDYLFLLRSSVPSERANLFETSINQKLLETYLKYYGIPIGLRGPVNVEEVK